MLISILTSDKQRLAFDTEAVSQYWPSTPMFQFFEKLFWAWFNSANPADELEEKYFGDEAIYVKKGAIIELMETMAEVAEERPDRKSYTEKEIGQLDIESCLSS